MATSVAFALVMLLSFNIYAQDVSKLNEDKDFISYLEDQLNFVDTGNGELLNKIDIDKFENEDNEQINLFYTAFSTNEELYKIFLDKQSDRINRLNKTYGFDKLGEKELTDEINQFLNTLPRFAGGNNCKRRYRNALAINFAVAVGAHIACGTADITVILGIICHGATAIAHQAANDNAYLDYQDCLN